jgi:hypothetical protein
MDPDTELEVFSNITWFAREAPSENCFEDNPHSLNEKLDIGKVIYISYQADRYSTLPDILHKYEADTEVYMDYHFDTLEKAQNKAKESEISSVPIICLKSDKGITDYTFSVETDKIFTVGDILNHIYRFYTSIMSKEEIIAIATTDDGWGYNEKAKNSLVNKTVLYREQVMGDCMHFEGLRYIGNKDNIPTYKVIFGS